MEKTSCVDDTALSLEPYFKIREGKVADFKAYFTNKVLTIYENRGAEKTINYGFSYNGNYMHCRESYRDAAGFLKHMENVGAYIDYVLKHFADVHKISCHGPKEEVDKCREALKPLGTKFYNLEWGYQHVGDAPQFNDTCVSLEPYFKIHEGKVDEFKSIWKAAFQKDEPGCLYYGFTFDGSNAKCREGYRSAKDVLAHLALVDTPLKKALGVADLECLEVHGPKEEVDVLREALKDLKVDYYEMDWGFRTGP